MIEFAYANQVPQGASVFANFAMPVLFIAIFYFLLIRPQQKRQKELAAMVAALSEGDEVVFAGGLIGRIIELHGDYVRIALGAQNKVIIQKASVTGVLPKGTLDSL